MNAARAFVALLVMTAAMGANAQIAYPPPDCDDGTQAQCIARLIPFDFNQHAARARLEPLESGGTTLCIPPRYLELWDPKARDESEAACNLRKGALDAVGRYFACPLSGAGGPCPRPQVGITLEGGGSKSAPFSLGVLAGLQRTGVLAQADIVGSASGGTYAAYFYFARILDSMNDPEYRGSSPAQWFQDCFPSMYAEHLPESLANHGAVRFCKEERFGEYVALTPGNTFYKQVPFQYQPKAGQDLFSPFQTVMLRGQHWYDVDWLAAGGLVTVMLGAQLVSIPPHLFLHGLFNIAPNTSPTRELYREGIERAYGHSVASWNRAQLEDDVLFPARDSCPELFTGSRFKRSWTLDDLADAYRERRKDCPQGKSCAFPLWILSTTSSPGRSSTFWIEAQPRDMQRFAYEIGPHGQGSGLLGFFDVPPRATTLRDAVGISAAFLDDQQRSVMSTPVTQFAVSSLIFALNLEWGTDVPNFNESDTARKYYRVVPWPFYWLPRFQGLQAPYVRLSDGGNVDNLGLVALLRRGVRQIVVSASTDDDRGSFSSLCKLKNELELEIAAGRGHSVYKLHVPALQDLDKVCTRVLDRQEVAVWGLEAVRALFCKRWGVAGEACEAAWNGRGSIATHTGYDLWNWPYPIVEGCVVRRDADDDDPTIADTCTRARGEGREISRLIIIKPAVQSHAVLQQAPGKQVQWCHWGNDDIDIGTEPPNTIAPGMNLPCITLAYLALNDPVEYKPCEQHHHVFPQDDFIKMTLNSSYTMFGAYYDLGRHLAGQVAPCDADPSRLCVRHPSAARIEVCPRAKG